MRNGSLWSNVVFEKEVIFHEFDFETSDLEFEVSKSSIWKHTTSCDKGVFSFIIISQLRQPIELKFSQVCYFMHMLRYTKWEDWSLTVTNSVQCLYFTHFSFKKYPNPLRTNHRLCLPIPLRFIKRVMRVKATV